MQEERKELVERGLETAFIDRRITSSKRYKPQFISNDFVSGRKVLTFIEKDLSALSNEEAYVYVIETNVFQRYFDIAIFNAG